MSKKRKLVPESSSSSSSTTTAAAAASRRGKLNLVPASSYIPSLDDDEEEAKASSFIPSAQNFIKHSESFDFCIVSENEVHQVKKGVMEHHCAMIRTALETNPKATTITVNQSRSITSQLSRFLSWLHEPGSTLTSQLSAKDIHPAVQWRILGAYFGLTSGVLSQIDAIIVAFNTNDSNVCYPGAALQLLGACGASLTVKGQDTLLMAWCVRQLAQKLLCEIAALSGNGYATLNRQSPNDGAPVHIIDSIRSKELSVGLVVKIMACWGAKVIGSLNQTSNALISATLTEAVNKNLAIPSSTLPTTTTIRKFK